MKDAPILTKQNSLARNLSIAFMASHLGVSLRTAERQYVEPEERLDPLWQELADVAIELVTRKLERAIALDEPKLMRVK